MSNSSFGSELEFYEDTGSSPSEEIRALDVAIEITSDIIDDLQATLNFTLNLAVKFERRRQNYLRAISTDSICMYPEYLTLDIDGLMNEQRQKHDLNSPQQHHKVQEINDGSGSDTRSGDTSIINHPTEANEDYEFKVDDGGDGDKKSSDEDECGGFRLMTDFWNRWSVYNKVKKEKTHVKHGLRMAMGKLQHSVSCSQSQSIGNRGYMFKKTKFTRFLNSCDSVIWARESTSARNSPSIVEVKPRQRPASEIIQSKQINKF